MLAEEKYAVINQYRFCFWHCSHATQWWSV